MYIKLFEEWINEGKKMTTSNDFTKFITKEVQSNNMEIDKRLNELAKHGKFANQIRSAIRDKKGKYSDPVWNTIGTLAGVDSAIEKFKDMFDRLTGGKETTDYLSKFEQMMNSAIGSSVDKFEFTDKILNSKNAVSLMNLIKFGNQNFANEIGTYFAMYDLACAITNGFYFTSNQIPLVTKGSEINNPFKNVREAIDGQSNPFKSFKNLLEQGEQNFKTDYNISHENIRKSKGIWGQNITFHIPLKDYELSIGEFKGYLDVVDLEMLKKVASDKFEKYGFTEPGYVTVGNDFEPSNRAWVSRLDLPNEFFGILYIGHYYNNIGLSVITRAFNFMEEGGATWYQKKLA